MLQKLQKRNNDQKGFTIIEVLIVLAIAGLILLIVFLAVPALQRNARNTGRKNDVANILGALSEYTNNNGGVFPVSCAEGTGAGACGAAGTFLANAKLGTIPSSQVKLTVNTTAAGAAAAPAALDHVEIRTYDKCASATADGGANATTRSVVAMFKVETGGAPIDQCQESGS